MGKQRSYETLNSNSNFTPLEKKRTHGTFNSGPSHANKKQKTNSSTPTPQLAYVPSRMPHALPAPRKPHSKHTSSSTANLPPLPPILDPTLRRAPFTHIGTVGGPLSSATTSSYERLEWLGDAYLQVLSSRLIFATFPSDGPGPLSQKRETLIKNETLANFARGYGFEARATLPRDWADMKPMMKMKILGDMFEAYVAAVVLSDAQKGFETVEAWMTELWLPLMWDDGLGARWVEPGAEGAKEELSRKIAGVRVHIEYRYEGDPAELKDKRRGDGKEIFRMGVYLTGWGWENCFLGAGEGISKKDGGNVAALRALKNPLTDEVAAVKRAFDAKTKAEREAKAKEKEKEEDWVPVGI